jgi:methylated-DNA-protein-cysteine methyltransferase-like protein
MKHEPTFPQQVVALVRRIPRGRIVSYGQIARALGRPRAARIVGGVMSSLGPEHLDVPWHRVLNRLGGISPRSDPFCDREPTVEQAERLLEEGLEPDGEGLYDLALHGLEDGELKALAQRATDDR